MKYSLSLLLVSGLLFADSLILSSPLNNTPFHSITTTHINGTACDDQNPLTSGETWLNDICQGGSNHNTVDNLINSNMITSGSNSLDLINTLNNLILNPPITPPSHDRDPLVDPVGNPDIPDIIDCSQNGTCVDHNSTVSGNNDLVLENGFLLVVTQDATNKEMVKIIRKSNLEVSSVGDIKKLKTKVLKEYSGTEIKNMAQAVKRFSKDVKSGRKDIRTLDGVVIKKDGVVLDSDIQAVENKVNQLLDNGDLDNLETIFRSSQSTPNYIQN